MAEYLEQVYTFNKQKQSKNDKKRKSKRNTDPPLHQIFQDMLESHVNIILNEVIVMTVYLTNDHCYP